jgi:hypothetical protein
MGQRLFSTAPATANAAACEGTPGGGLGLRSPRGWRARACQLQGAASRGAAPRPCPTRLPQQNASPHLRLAVPQLVRLQEGLHCVLKGGELGGGVGLGVTERSMGVEAGVRQAAWDAWAQKGPPATPSPAAKCRRAPRGVRALPRDAGTPPWSGPHLPENLLVAAAVRAAAPHAEARVGAADVARQHARALRAARGKRGAGWAGARARRGAPSGRAAPPRRSRPHACCAAGTRPAAAGGPARGANVRALTAVASARTTAQRARARSAPAGRRAAARLRAAAPAGGTRCGV